MEKKKINSTLCYIEKDGYYLMLYRNKKKNDPCEGKWVGVGGKFEPGETADACLLREVWEETSLHLTDYTFRGIIEFLSDQWTDEDMYLYSADAFEGEDNFPVWGSDADTSRAFDCSEGDLWWIPKEQILNLNLWEGDTHFLTPLIEGKKHIYMTCRYEGHTCVEVTNEKIYD